jgi:hypothetical protein
MQLDASVSVVGPRLHGPYRQSGFRGHHLRRGPRGFRVDPGTEMTTLPAYDAKSLELPIPKKPVSNLVLYGQAFRSGLLRARVIGMDQTGFVFPCYFVDDPDIFPLAQGRNLLGLTGVINQISHTFDGRSSVRSPRGVLVVES